MSTIATAELPPYVYKERQETAPEYLDIRVLSVKTAQIQEPRRVRSQVTVHAKVRRVHRSRSGVKPGDVVRIRYEHIRYLEPIAGPSEAPILKVGETCPAFLTANPKEKSYAPAAGGYSFRVMK